ncbi:MAG: galactokinase [Clostridia bacterium]|nr:galactokinase [Clostridia bacterium]
MNVSEFLLKINNGEFDNAFVKLYGEDAVAYQRNRYSAAAEKFVETYPGANEIEVFSASGRTEICGNHTDHQHGCVLAAAVDVDVISIVAFNQSGVIRVLSEGYRPVEIDCANLGIQEGETGSAALIRGVASKFAERGIEIGGFDMYSTSDVLAGSGISSSAAFETIIGTVIDKHYADGRVGAVEIAKIGQFAENVYFGKQCGLMDQMVSSVGGFVFIDFADNENPVIENYSVDFDSLGYDLFITDTKGSHADLTDDYVAVRSEMDEVAAFFGKKYLRETDEKLFVENIAAIREKCSDRAVLRAMHFMAENLRPKAGFEALKAGDVEGFLRQVRESGESSERLLQNIYSVKKPLEQAVNIGLALSREVLGKQGASRVHGGGFAGTIQAFVPKALSSQYKATLDAVFGEGSCRLMRIRPVGGIDFIEFAEGRC